MVDNAGREELKQRISEMQQFLADQTPQNFNKKLKRGTVSFEEMMAIAEALGVEYEQAFVLPDGKRIGV